MRCYSSVGRAAVSKTACREFETYYPCHKRTGSSEPVRFVFAMFLRFRIGSASLCQYQWKNYFYLHFRKICGFSGSAFSRKGSFREAILFIYSTCYGRGRSGKQHFGTCHGWGCRTPSANCSAKAPSPRELARRKPCQREFPHIFSDF